MKLDKTDFRILWNMDYNARIPMSELAKKANISKQNLNYRIQKLVNNNVLKDFMSVIDIHRLGYFTYRVYLRYKNVDEKKEKEIIGYFYKHKNVLWLVSLKGSWDLEIVFTARNFVHFNNLFKKMKEDLSQYFTRYNVNMSVVNYHFKRDYLLNLKREEFNPKYYGFEPKPEKLDELDVKILNELSKNCRQTNQEIGRKLGVTYHTIKQRISKLQEKKIIQSHRYTIDLNKLGRKYIKAALFLNNPSKEEEKKLYAFCSQFNFVTYLVEVLGEWQLEVETEVENEDQFWNLLKNIRNKFPDLILDYEVFEMTNEHKLNYFAIGE